MRELSKCMDGATWDDHHEMLCVIKFVIDTKDLGLKIEPKDEGEMNCNLSFFCDSINVTRFIVYLLDVPICWLSKAQRRIQLSCTEAENIAISEATREIKFIIICQRICMLN
jgi:hypothetical protein